MSHRLLYRGALSLPESYFLLDGLTFTARLDATRNLIDNPLALALESMRGRPSLRFMGTVNYKKLYIDDSGEITVDIHPEATLSRLYFENLFCLEVPSEEGEKMGLRVALGDTIGPETTQILIFPKPILSEQSETTTTTPMYALAVARILSGPPASRARIPRPDDPTPRKPPPVPFGFAAKAKLKSQGPGNISRVPSGSFAVLGKEVRLGETDVDVFKVPVLPVNKDKGKGKATNSKGNAFGSGTVLDGSSSSASSKGKRKRIEETDIDIENATGEAESPIERENKNRIKRVIVQELSKSSITKGHKEYREVFNHVYMGVCFALRANMKTGHVPDQPMQSFVKSHVSMYACSPRLQTENIQDEHVGQTEMSKS
ncbi:hypothetical protein K435DRAFT_962852 [Dendrothele bispora CBS 962.96]|uniref:Sld7 C-terminal domain-containing protein n=1 Tax=Dendrothele bispora (strain CBS 962.96) TaxID=1314807 RepID=A0A4S8MK96_DENBC|nr:hypothetical protein K435DRAFT_962852 [Dendrothele bispora CBS 962.96]